MKRMLSIAALTAVAACGAEGDDQDFSRDSGIATRTLTCEPTGTSSSLASVVEVRPDSASSSLTVAFVDGDTVDMHFDGSTAGIGVGTATNYTNRNQSPRPRATLLRTSVGDGLIKAALSYDIAGERDLVELSCIESSEDQGVETIADLTLFVEKYARCIRSGDFFDFFGPVEVPRNLSGRRLENQVHADLLDTLDEDEDDYSFEQSKELHVPEFGGCASLEEVAATLDQHATIVRMETAQSNFTDQFRRVIKMKMKIDGVFVVYTVMTGHDGE